MKKYSGLISVCLFVLSLIGFIIMLLGNDKLLFTCVILSILSFLLAIYAEKSIYQKIGLIGSCALLVVILLIPFIVTTFFWNEP